VDACQAGVLTPLKVPVVSLNEKFTLIAQYWFVP